MPEAVKEALGDTGRMFGSRVKSFQVAGFIENHKKSKNFSRVMFNENLDNLSLGESWR